MQALFLLLAILVGIEVPIQFAVKGELRETVGRTITTAAIAFLVGTFVLGAAVLLVRKQGRPGSPRPPRRRDEPGSGLLSVFNVTASISLTPSSGRRISWRSSSPVRCSPR